MKIFGKQIIGNLNISKGSNKFYGINPKNGEKLEPAYFEATVDEVNLAVDKAKKAFLKYRKVNNIEKSKFLETIADEILKLNNSLITRCNEETALGEKRLIAERTRTVNQIKMFANLVKEGSWVEAIIDPKKSEPQRVDIRRMLIPIGPVGIFGASNFPLAFSVAGGDTISALAAGCSVVVKANPAHPGTSEMVGRAIVNAINKCNMPDGIFSLIFGKSYKPGILIVNHDLIKGIAFTGSAEGGKAIFDEAQKREVPIPVFAEMGSSNPIFILPGIIEEDPDTIAQDLCTSVNLGVGQFCTNPGLVFLIDSAISQRLIEKISQKFSEIQAGCMLTNETKFNFDKKIVQLKNNGEINILSSGITSLKQNFASAKLLQTNIDNFIKNPDLAEEVFGPSTLVVFTKHKKELLKAVNILKGHLTASIIGNENDFKEYKEIIDILKLKVGRLIINNYPTGVVVGNAMHHGGPFPATTSEKFTSVGTQAIKRFSRPICYQNFPQSLLPDELKDANPLKIWRMIDGEWKDPNI